jgi:hypothetical protein
VATYFQDVQGDQEGHLDSQGTKLASWSERSGDIFPTAAYDCDDDHLETYWQRSIGYYTLDHVD